jgi:Holliday junction resolvasome RuvABC endonuclease subunit
VCSTRPTLASTILTFYDPKKYAVSDIHIWREMYWKEPENLFTTENYLKLLADLRRIGNYYNPDVRTVEKALFKKNIDETSS